MKENCKQDEHRYSQNTTSCANIYSQDNKIIIFDTTLRDGSQSPGAKMDYQGKIEIAQQLENLGVDVIEAGFPVSSEGNFNTVEQIAKAIKNSTVCALARANQHDIEVAGKAIAKAERKRIHTFIATSPIHMEHKLKMSKEMVIERAIFAIKEAKKWTNDVQFSAEDAFRSDIDFLCEIVEKAINAGATTINLPDTVGYATPFEYGMFFKTIMERVPNSDKAIFSAHCHNDLGMAVANSLSAIMNGVKQVECCINGLGERAGNAALEEIVMAIKTRKDIFKCYTTIQHNQILNTSKMVSNISNIQVQRNKAIVGENAFAHESGIHQDGVLKNRSTYEIMAPQDVGWTENKIILGKNSGKAAIKNSLQKLGVNIYSEEHMEAIFVKFKTLTDQQHVIEEHELLQII